MSDSNKYDPLYVFYSWRYLSTALELLCDGSNVLALVECLLQFEFCRLPGTISGISSSTIWATTLHILHLEHTSTKCVADWDEYHAMVSQLSDGSQTVTSIEKYDLYFVCRRILYMLVKSEKDQ